MASLNQIVSEIAHTVGEPNNKALKEHIKLLVVQTRNELIRRSYENHGYVDKGITQRYKVSLVDVADGDIVINHEDEIVVYDKIDVAFNESVGFQHNQNRIQAPGDKVGIGTSLCKYIYFQQTDIEEEWILTSNGFRCTTSNLSLYFVDLTPEDEVTINYTDRDVIASSFNIDIKEETEDFVRFRPIDNNIITILLDHTSTDVITSISIRKKSIVKVNIDISKDILPIIKRTEQRVPRPVRLTNNLPFNRVSSVGHLTNREFPFIKETSARFRSSVPGLCGMPCYDYINGFIYLFPINNKPLMINKIIIEGAFEHPTEIEMNNNLVDSLNILDGDNEWLLPEDMVGQITDIIIKRNLLSLGHKTNETPNEVKFNQ